MARHVFQKVHIGYLAAIVAASNAGGSGSVVGDTTTTMMWIDGVSPLKVLDAYVAAALAMVIFGIPAALQQHRLCPIVKDSPRGLQIDWVRAAIVALILIVAILANVIANLKFPALLDAIPVIGLAVQLEIAPGRTVTTVGYNGTVPGPLIRFREGVSATVDIFNDTDAAEYVHWHGLRRSHRCRWRRGRGEPCRAGAWPPSLPDGAPAVGMPVRTHARHVHVGSEPRRVHGPVCVRPYRTENQPRPLRPGDLSRRHTNGALSSHPWRNRRTAVRSNRCLREITVWTPIRTDGRWTTAILRSTAGVWATASRFASRKARPFYSIS